jgi:hypothetical protein
LGDLEPWRLKSFRSENEAAREIVIDEVTDILSIRAMATNNPTETAPQSIESLLSHRCSFACAGTYGHECGAPAKWVGVRKSDITKSGVYFARRCDACKAERGGENVGISHFEALNTALHRNEWK